MFPSDMRKLAKKLTQLRLGPYEACVLRPLREGEGERRRLPGWRITAKNDEELARKVGAKYFEEGLSAGSAREDAKAERQRRLHQAAAARMSQAGVTSERTQTPAHAAVTPGDIARRFKPHKPVVAPPKRTPREEEAAIPVARRSGGVAVEASGEAPRPAHVSSRTSYRAFWRVAGPVISTVRAQLLTWLESKRVPAALVEAESAEELIDGALHRWTFDVGRSGGSSALTFTLEQPAKHGTFATEISAFEGEGVASWVFVHVRDDADQFVDSPNIAVSLIRALDIREADHRLGVDFDRPHGEAALALLEDEQRRLPVVMFAAKGTPGEVHYDTAVQRASQWVRKLVEQAHLVVQEGSGQDSFNASVAKDLTTWPGSMRVYKPGFQRDDPEQSLSHRYLSKSYLIESDDSRVSGRLIGLVRAVAQQGQAPSDVRRARWLFDRIQEERKQAQRKAELQQAAAPVDAVAPETTTPTERQFMVQLLALVQSRYGVDTSPKDVIAELEDRLTTQDLTPKVEELQSALDRTAEELGLAQLELQEVRNDAMAESADLEHQLENAKREASYYQQELAKLDAGRAYSFVDHDPVEDIDDIEIVLSRTSELAHVEVTWDENVVRQIPDWDKNNLVPRNAWQALKALDAFAKAWTSGEFRGNFLDYAQKHEGLGPRKIAMQESNQTMKRWGREREFRVPTTVDPSGVYRMQSHIRLCSQSGSIATRMYFLDDLARTGKIYVGYLGEHLTNTQTANF